MICCNWYRVFCYILSMSIRPTRTAIEVAKDSSLRQIYNNIQNARQRRVNGFPGLHPDGLAVLILLSRSIMVLKQNSELLTSKLSGYVAYKVKVWSVSKDSHLVSSPFNVKHVFSKRNEEACDQLCLHCKVWVSGDLVEREKAC